MTNRIYPEFVKDNLDARITALGGTWKLQLVDNTVTWSTGHSLIGDLSGSTLGTAGSLAGISTAINSDGLVELTTTTTNLVYTSITSGTVVSGAVMWVDTGSDDPVVALYQSQGDTTPFEFTVTSDDITVTIPGVLARF